MTAVLDGTTCRDIFVVQYGVAFWKRGGAEETELAGKRMQKRKRQSPVEFHGVGRQMMAFAQGQQS